MENKLLDSLGVLGETVLEASGVTTASKPAGYKTALPLRNSPAPEAGEHYARHLAPLEQDYEKARTAALEELKFRIGAAILLTTAGLFFICSLQQYALAAGWYGPERESAGLGINYLVIAAILSAVWAYMPVHNFSTTLRDEIYPRIFSFFGGDFRYMRAGREDFEHDLAASKIAPGHTQLEVDDYIVGSRNGVGIELIDLELSRRGHKGRKVTVFDGLGIVLTPVRRFHGRIIIDEDHGFVANSFSGAFSSGRRELRRVKLEDPEFERQFEVYADDQISVRTVLTTSFMDRLTQLKRKLGVKGLSCSFFDGKIMFLLPTNIDHFPTPSLFQPLDLAEQLQIIISEMQLIFEMIEDLRLDQDIGL